MLPPVLAVPRSCGDVADDSAEPPLQDKQLPLMPPELVGMGVAAALATRQYDCRRLTPLCCSGELTRPLRRL